jgi:hypothetical protein
VSKEILGEGFKQALLDLVNQGSNADWYSHYTSENPESDDRAVDVLDFYQTKRSSGSCDTCYYEYTVVVVTYRTESGDVREYVYGDDFADLIRTLVGFGD